MAYVTIEEVAQYLADNGYTRWTDLSLQKVLTESGMWNCLQTNYNSAHAIDSRYITFPTVDLSAYATEAAMKSWVQSQGYLTSVPSPDLSSYATQAWVLGRGYLTSHQSLDDYATKTWVGLQTSSLASQVWVGNNFVSKATFDDLFEKVNIGTEQSPVYAIHAKLGLYSGSFISAGGIGTSGGGGGGGLTWDNLAAATTEQIALSHLTTALSGYLTSYGNRPSIGMAGSSVSWIPENYGVILPLTSMGGGNYQLDLSGYAQTSDLHSHSNKSVLDGITSNKVNNWDAAYGWGNHASAGYVTGYGNRPQIGNLSDSVVTWLPASAYVVMPLVYHAGAGYYQLNLSSYVKTSGNNTFSGTNTFTNEIYMSGTRSIVFNDDSGIAANGSDELELYGNNGVRISSDTVVEGTVTATGFVNSSDLRRKNLFGDVSLSVADIAAMPAVRFRWNSGRDTQAMHVGTIAQAWQTLLPEVVTQGSDGLLSMDYASAALVSVINVAQVVSNHERRILDLEAENRRLKAELEQLKAA